MLKEMPQSHQCSKKKTDKSKQAIDQSVCYMYFKNFLKIFSQPNATLYRQNDVVLLVYILITQHVLLRLIEQ